VVPDNLNAVIYLNSWQVPPLWKLIQQKGNISTHEMYRVFNMGIGMIAIVGEETVSKIQELIPEETFVIGELVTGTKQVQLVS